MFTRLRKKWNVTARQFWIIFTVFGFTGLTTAYFTKIISGLLGMDEKTWWVWRWSVKIAMLLVGYQVLLLLYGALFGQWAFFWKYEKKILQKLRLMKKSKVESQKSKDIAQDEKQDAERKMQIAIFASGAGSNAAKIIEHFSGHPSIIIALIVCNKPVAGVLSIAGQNGIDTLIIEKERFFRGDGYVPELKENQIDFIVLAGFLWKIPQTIIDTYRGHIVNIHPALLPKFGGKGMFGNNVHAAVIDAGEKESGITIHLVDEHYDNGDIVFQGKCEVSSDETPASLAERIHVLEHKHYPEVIEKIIKQNFFPADNADLR